MSGFHLPDVDSAIRAADDQKVVHRAPLDRAHRKQMTTRDQLHLQLVFLEMFGRVNNGGGVLISEARVDS